MTKALKKPELVTMTPQSPHHIILEDPISPAKPPEENGQQVISLLL